MRGRRAVAVVAAVGVAAFGCTSGTDDGALELDDATASPTEIEPDPPTEPPDEGDEEPEEPLEDDEPLFPPLPPLEPDPASDIPIETQEAALALHAKVYQATQSALHTTEFDPDELAQLLHGELLEETLTVFQRRRDEGVVSRSTDTEVRYVEVAQAHGGPIVIHECSIVGPETATYDAETGERVAVADRDEPVGLLLEVRYELVEVEPDLFDYRAISVETIDSGDRCIA